MDEMLEELHGDHREERKNTRLGSIMQEPEIPLGGMRYGFID